MLCYTSSVLPLFFDDCFLVVLNPCFRYKLTYIKWSIVHMAKLLGNHPEQKESKKYKKIANVLRFIS